MSGAAAAPPPCSSAAATNPGLPPDAKVQLLQGLRRTPLWAAALRHARSIPTEVDSYATYSFDPAELRGFTTPTLLLLGSTSGPVERRWVEDLHAVLPASRIVMLEGQGHGTMHTARPGMDEVVIGEVGDARPPELFVRTVRAAVD